MKLTKAIALRIKELREAAGLSQQEVAMRADLSLSLVAKLEQGKKADPRASTLLALAHALNVIPGRLLEDLFAPAPEPAPEAEPPGEAEKNALPVDTGLDAKPAKKKKKHKKAKAKAKPKLKVK